MKRPEELDQERKRILQRLGLLTWGLWGAAAVLALGGGALIAWLFRSTGLPFLRTWLVVSSVLLVIPAVINLVTKRE